MTGRQGIAARFQGAGPEGLRLDGARLNLPMRPRHVPRAVCFSLRFIDGGFNRRHEKVPPVALQRRHVAPEPPPHSA